MSVGGATPGQESIAHSLRRWWPYLSVAGLFWVVPGLALLVGYLTLPGYNASGQCEGIGFGCVLTPKDRVQFAAMFLYPFVFWAGLLTMGVITFARKQPAWLIPITAMGAALIFGSVIAMVFTHKFSTVLVVVSVGLILALPGTLQRWRKGRSR